MFSCYLCRWRRIRMSGAVAQAQKPLTPTLSRRESGKEGGADGGVTMNRFAYREAQTVQEAVEMMRQEEGARIVAGATDVLIRWRQGVWKPRYVLNIKRIPGLDEVSYSPDTGLSLGALVTVRTLERHPLLQEHYPALAQAA